MTIHIPNLLDPQGLPFNSEYASQYVLFSMIKDIALLGGSLLIAGACQGNNVQKES